MKKYILLSVFIFVCLALSAQLPDWAMSKPVSSNYTMDYEVGIGEGDTYKQAQNEAYIEVLKKLISRCRLPITASAVMQSVYEGKPLKTIDKDFVLPPIREVCSKAIQTSNGKIRVYLLYQVPRDGSISSPQYEDFSDCYSVGMISRRSNIRSIIASVFIPGMGQMLKHHYVEGSLTLVGELALLGAGVGTYFGAKKQTQIMNSYGIDYDTYKAAQKARPIYQGVSYTCFGLATILYGVNLWRAYTLEPNHDTYAFYPTIIPVDNNNYAIGLGANIKF